MKRYKLELHPSNFFFSTMLKDIVEYIKKLVCLYICCQLSVFPDNSTRVCHIKLKIDKVYYMNNTVDVLHISRCDFNFHWYLHLKIICCLIKKKLYSLFKWVGLRSLQGCRATMNRQIHLNISAIYRDNLLLTTKWVPCNLMISLVRINSWIGLEATKWFGAEDPGIGNIGH